MRRPSEKRHPSAEKLGGVPIGDTGSHETWFKKEQRLDHVIRATEFELVDLLVDCMHELDSMPDMHLSKSTDRTPSAIDWFSIIQKSPRVLKICK